MNGFFQSGRLTFSSTYHHGKLALLFESPVNEIHATFLARMWAKDSRAIRGSEGLLLLLMVAVRSSAAFGLLLIMRLVHQT